MTVLPLPLPPPPLPPPPLPPPPLPPPPSSPPGMAGGWGMGLVVGRQQVPQNVVNLRSEFGPGQLLLPPRRGCGLEIRWLAGGFSSCY